MAYTVTDEVHVPVYKHVFIGGVPVYLGGRSDGQKQLVLWMHSVTYST